MIRRLRAFQLRALLSQAPADYPTTNAVETVQSLKARLWNNSLSKGQVHQIRQELSRLNVR